MNIIITDSGLGGLDVAARLFEWMNNRSEPLYGLIIFANALPETGHGYNKMKTEQAKITIFDEALAGFNRYFNPDIIGIACNTLSVLAPKTPFSKRFEFKLKNIIDCSVDSFVRQYQPKQEVIIVFGTETTISSSVYQKKMIKAGISEKKLIARKCPHLASEIELNHKSKKTQDTVANCVSGAIRYVTDRNARIFIYLACSHYGYVSDLFHRSFVNNGCTDFEIINPNDYLLDSLKNIVLERLCEVIGKPKIEVYSRCEILAEEIESISELLVPISGKTVEALAGYNLKEDLF